MSEASLVYGVSRVSYSTARATQREEKKKSQQALCVLGKQPTTELKPQGQRRDPNLCMVFSAVCLG